MKTRVFRFVRSAARGLFTGAHPGVVVHASCDDMELGLQRRGVDAQHVRVRNLKKPRLERVGSRGGSSCPLAQMLYLLTEE